MVHWLHRTAQTGCFVAAQALQQSMQEHLRLHFNNEEASDEQVSYPGVCVPAELMLDQ